MSEQKHTSCIDIFFKTFIVMEQEWRCGCFYHHFAGGTACRGKLCVPNYAHFHLEKIKNKNELNWGLLGV